MEMMKAIIISQPGEANVLQMTQRPIPTIGNNNVLIKVKAAGINRPDIAQRKGRYPAPKGSPADLPGLEIAGKIVAIGQQVNRWKIGDKVCALVSGGGYAEYCLAPENQCLPIPQNLNFIEAASLPETYFTVWSNVFDRGKLKSNERFLVHGGSSGIGVAAIQMAKSWGAKVFVTAGTDDKCAFCLQLGADKAINYKSEDFESACLQFTGNKGVDVILDMIGGDYTSKNINILATEGRLVLINTMKGKESTINLMEVMKKRLIITGSTLRARENSFKGKIAQNLEKHIWPMLRTGKIKPIIHKVFPLTEAAEAHRLMESSKHIGKIILEING